jgi:glycosyltransferase involved in cell wall biosynthesis
VRFKETQLRDAEFLEPDVDFLEPDADGNDAPRDFVDALDRWETFYADLENSGITHVLVVNPEGVVALADTKLVEYLGDVRVAVLNTRSPISLAAQAATEGARITDVDFLGWTKKDVALVMSIGPHLHDLWKQELDSSGVSLERVHLNIAPLSPLCFTKAAGGASGVCQIHTLPMGEDEDSREFLQTVAAALSHVALALNTQHKSVAWTVWTHAPTRSNNAPSNGNVDREALKNTLGKILAHRVEVNILPLTSLEDLEKQLQKASLVIQDGRLDRPGGGYSGLESLMCGVPTLLPNRSPQLSHLLLSINEPKARYFVLPDQTEAWPEKILHVLEDVAKASEHALDLAKAVQEQHKYTLRAFATWLGKRW